MSVWTVMGDAVTLVKIWWVRTFAPVLMATNLMELERNALVSQR